MKTASQDLGDVITYINKALRIAQRNRFACQDSLTKALRVAVGQKAEIRATQRTAQAQQPSNTA